MRKIDYTFNGKVLVDFHQKYVKALIKVDISKINKELRKAPKFRGNVLTFKKLVTLNFDELYELTNNLNTFISGYNTSTIITSRGKTKTIITNKFNDLFKYKENQPSISSFFMNEGNLDIKTCYYCGIDYVNSFKDIGDYFDSNDFLNRATFQDLQYIDGIGEVKAKKIIEYRKTKKITKPEEITSSVKLLNQIKKINFKNSHNHFTLDHVFPQSQYQYLSLCLYNLIPSCYSCNSKFKGKREFINNQDILKISPTSKFYSLTSDFEFKIFYADKLQDIRTINDFTLFKKIHRNKLQIENYTSIFKLDGRYTFHKDELLDLIKMKSEYSNAKIKNMAIEMGKSQDEIKELIFGKEIFQINLNKPFHKLKSDIAKNIKIIK